MSPLFKTPEGVVVGFQNFAWAPKGLGEMFKGDSEDICAGKYSLISMGGRTEGLACADPGARTPIGASGN